MTIPSWLNILAWFSLTLALLCVLAISIDEPKHPQKMWIMHLVWPLTALYASVLALWGYFAIGRGMARDASHRPMHRRAGNQQRSGPAWQEIAVSASHCGAGCMLADILGEYLVFAAGWSLGGQTLYADYAVTLGLAWLFGVAFQYFSIKPMQQLSSGEALLESIKADTLSILFFQVGMYGWMALVYFVLFPHPHLELKSPVFWFMEQIGMLVGFVTTLPVNRWLLQRGVKEAMG